MSRIVSLLLVGLVFVTLGCAKLTLKHTPLTAASTTVGSVSLVVNNARPEEYGAGNEMQVGRLRNLYGMAIKFEAQNSLVDAITALCDDALKSAGLNVSNDAPSQVVVDITQFFMDGYMGYKMESVLNVKVNKGGAAVFQKEIVKAHGFGHMTNKDLYEAYDAYMDMIAEEAVAVFSSPEFQSAVQ